MIEMIDLFIILAYIIVIALIVLEYIKGKIK